MGREIPVPYHLKGKKIIDNITDGEELTGRNVPVIFRTKR